MSSSNPLTKTKDELSSSSKNPSQDDSDIRIWIGNLDQKLTEFQLLKIIQKFGNIEHFDYLFHRSGPCSGLPRGYAFVTFKEKSSAEKCLNDLNGKKILERRVAVKWAHQANYTYLDEDEKIKRKLPALGMKTERVKSSIPKDKAISAIEAKLREMDREKESNFNNFKLIVPSNSKRMKRPY